MKVLVTVILLSVLAWAANVVCPLHYNAPCYNTGQVRFVNGRQFQQYRCSCGDVYWVAQ